MYSTCLYCTHALGRNEVLESFPVGRRLAYDAANGRLWVVCPHCARWNLSPLEERWEAMEQAERRFRETRLRVSTDQIGLARLHEGLELVRIGRPVLSVRHIEEKLHASGEAATRLTGDDALRAAARLFPATNRFGGTSADVRLAVSRIEHAGSASRYFATLAHSGAQASRVTAAKTSWWHGGDEPTSDSGLLAMPLSVRLAIEMVVHEEQERRALDGELAALALEWRQAEEIAAIADDLLVPVSVREGLARLRGSGR